MLPHSLYRRHTGFSLVEIMVGIAVGMLGIVVMMQMYSVFENQKRTSTSGNDAQNSAAIALHQLQRDIRHSGYGISRLDLLGCSVSLPSGGTLTAIAPVTINPASAVVPTGDPNTDTLLVVYGNGNGSPQGDEIDSGDGSSVLTMQDTLTILPGDYVIAENKSLRNVIPRSTVTIPSNCILSLNRVTAVAAKSVTVPTSVADGTLYNLGQSPQILAYAIRGGNLTVCKYVDIDPATGVDHGTNCGGAAAVWIPVASDIVSMKAQYWRDTLTPTPPTTQSSYVADTYDQNTPDTNCRWSRIFAVRVALVARGAVADGQVLTAPPRWAGSTNTPGDAININLSADTRWNQYHYKVFETTVPLRNVTWMGLSTRC